MNKNLIKQQTNYNNMKKLLTILFISFFLINCVSAFSLNKINQINTSYSIDFGEEKIHYNENWKKYKPIEIDSFFGFGKTLLKGSIKKHSDFCGENCYSIIDFYNEKETSLIDEIEFFEIKKNGNKIKKEINNYSLFILEDDEWVEYNLGQKVEKGNHQIKIIGKKKPKQTIDWVIKTNGKWIKEWAIWGGKYIYDDFEDDSIDYVSRWVFDNSSTDPPIESGGNLFLYGTTWSGIYTNETTGSFKNLGFNVTFVIGANVGEVSGANEIFLKNATSNTNGQCGIYKMNFNNNPIDSYINITISKNNETSVNVYKNNILNSTHNVGESCGAFQNLVGDLNSSWFYLRSNWNSYGIFNISSVNYELPGGIVTLNSPVNEYNSSLKEILFNCSASQDTATIVNISLYTNESGSFQLVNYTDGLTGNFNQTILSHNFTLDGKYDWNCQACDSDGDCGFAGINRTINIKTIPPQINLTYPRGLIDYHISGNNLSINWTVIDGELDSCWYTYNNTNTSVTCSDNYTMFTPEFNINNLTFYVNDSSNNVESNFTSWEYKVFQGNITYDNTTFIGEQQTILGNFTLYDTPNSITLIYNGTSYPSSISSSGENYLANTTFITPLFGSTQNVSFYYSINFDGDIINTSAYNQTVEKITLTTNCAGNFLAINISNFDEKSLASIVGNVSYRLRLIDANGNYITILNGTTSGSNIPLCSDVQLNLSQSNFDLSLYYNANDYVFRNYNIETTPLSTLPQSIYLYHLNNTLATEFKIIYTDYTYYKHPGAIVKIQKEYLGQDVYRTVEIPLISDDGTTTGSFETTNIRYKLIVVQNNQILDIFENIFPKCQSLVYGTCDLNLHGTGAPITEIGKVLEYQVIQNDEDNSIVVTYNVLSGEAKTVNLITNQSSRFLPEVSSCSSSLFSSGGTITCTYNNTVGNSIVDVQLLVEGEKEFHGNVLVSDNINLIFKGNNFFIGFIMLLTLALIFIGSEIIMVISAVGGLFFLGYVWLINIQSLNIFTIGTSVMWLIIAIGIAIYKLYQKEERTT